MILWIVAVKEIFDHDNEVVAEVDPIAIDLSIGRDAANDLLRMIHTGLSSLLSYFYLGLGSRLKDESFPPF